MADRSYFFAIEDKNKRLETTIDSVKYAITDFHIKIFEDYEFENEDRSIFINSNSALNIINDYFKRNRNNFSNDEIKSLINRYNSFKRFKYFGFNAIEILQNRYNDFLIDLKKGTIDNKYEVTDYIDWLYSENKIK